MADGNSKRDRVAFKIRVLWYYMKKEKMQLGIAIAYVGITGVQIYQRDWIGAIVFGVLAAMLIGLSIWGAVLKLRRDRALFEAMFNMDNADLLAIWSIGSNYPIPKNHHGDPRNN